MKDRILPTARYKRLAKIYWMILLDQYFLKTNVLYAGLDIFNMEMIIKVNPNPLNSVITLW
jgi:hypothetical protein